jgi:serine/threonine protein kinase
LRPSSHARLYEGLRLGPYVLQSVLGTGGMADVWRALDTRRNQRVAIKVIADDLRVDSQFAMRFLDEIRRHGRLRHPNIVGIVDALNVDGRLLMVMNLIDGESLADLLKRSPDQRLPTKVAIPIIMDVLSALDHAHRNGVWHRDVKPSNILLDSTNKPYLSDFGIALAVGEERRTRYGVPVGTGDYMSPEQIRTPQRVDHRTDVYSVGCVFYEMLTGRPPFIASELKRGASGLAVMAAHLNDVPVAPRARVASIPAGIDRLILWALKKNLDERLPGCGEFARLIAVESAEDADARLRAAVLRSGAPLVAGLGLLAAAVAAYLLAVSH